jgi:hypothetical protein
MQTYVIVSFFPVMIELLVKSHSFGPFFHPPTSLSISKHCYVQSNENILKYEYKMLELRN